LNFRIKLARKLKISRLIRQEQRPAFDIIGCPVAPEPWNPRLLSALHPDYSNTMETVEQRQ